MDIPLWSLFVKVETRDVLFCHQNVPEYTKMHIKFQKKISGIVTINPIYRDYALDPQKGKGRGKIYEGTLLPCETVDT